MSIQMPPSEQEQRAQLNSNAMANVAKGGVTEFASDPGVQVAGKIPSDIVADLFRLFGGVKKHRFFFEMLNYYMKIEFDEFKQLLCLD